MLVLSVPLLDTAEDSVLKNTSSKRDKEKERNSPGLQEETSARIIHFSE